MVSEIVLTFAEDYGIYIRISEAVSDGRLCGDNQRGHTTGVTYSTWLRTIQGLLGYSWRFHEHGRDDGTVCRPRILTNLHACITEVEESEIARPQSFQLVGDAEDVDVALIYHVEHYLSDINHQPLQRLIQLDSINAVSYCTAVPLLRKEPDARSHILLLSFESNSQLYCMPLWLKPLPRLAGMLKCTQIQLMVSYSYKNH